SEDPSRGYVDIRIPSDGRGIRTTAGDMVAIGKIGEPRRSPGRSYQRVEVVLVHHAVDALFTGQSVIGCESIEILLFGQRALLLRLDQKVLTEIGHLFFF